MRIFVATDINIIIGDGKILANGKHSTILRRYYNAFGPIVLCARYNEIAGDTRGLDDISGIIDSTVEIDSLHKMLLGKCNGKLENAMRDCDLVVGRCPSIAAYKAFDVAKRLKKPYFAESMGCAWDAYWNHGIVGKLIAPYMFIKMKSVVRNADYALYVTNEFLQKRYPCRCESVSASNVLIERIDENALSQRLERIKQSDMSKITLMTTAAVNVKYKGQQYVIRAIPKLNAMGIKVKYVLVGEGDNTYLKQEAEKYGVLDQVEFRGRVGLEEVFGILDTVDIYIQPSLQEGLPRSVIEAMSRACPVIGAKTAGIPELIDDEFVVRRKSVSDIVECVRAYVGMPKDERFLISERNFEEAKKYEAKKLNARRESYYELIKKQIMSRG